MHILRARRMTGTYVSPSTYRGEAWEMRTVSEKLLPSGLSASAVDRQLARKTANDRV